MTDRLARTYDLRPERSSYRTRFGVQTRVFGAIALIALIVAVGPAQVARAATGVISSVLLFKGVDRLDGVPTGTPYLAELCVSGPAIASASVSVNGGPQHVMIPIGGLEFCFEQNFASFAALDATFPAGSYVVSVTDTSASSDSATVDFQATEPTAFADFVSPTAAGTRPAGADLPVTWTLTSKGSCNTNSPATCVDGLQLFVVDQLTDSDVATQSLTPVANGALVPGSALASGTSYNLELETFRGTTGSTLTTSMGDTVPFTAIFEDINSIPITAGVPGVITAVELFKGVDRFDGVPGSTPYFVELCVQGLNLQSATIAAGGGTPQAMTMFDATEFCLDSQFASASALNAAFPAGDFTVSATDVSFASDSITVSFTATEPPAFLEFISPTNGATVSDQNDLSVSWSMNGCGGAPATCADGLLLGVINSTSDEDVDTQLMVPHATNTTVSANVLAPSTSYGLELETYRGTIGAASTDGGKPIGIVTIFESINFIQVPEPAAVLQSGAALAALCLLAWARPRSRTSVT